MIEKRELLFTEEDLALCLKPIVDVAVEMGRSRAIMTNSERLAIEAVITPHHVTKLGPKESVWESTVSFLVNLRIPKSQELEPRIFVADLNRVYVFLRGGKLETDFHLIELEEVESPSKCQVTIKWEPKFVDIQGKLTSSGKPQVITIHPISYASFDIDSIVEWIHKQWEINFIGKPESEKFRLTIGPPERNDQILGRFKLEDKEAGCGGLVSTYTSICDWMSFPVEEAILWDLDNYFYPHSLKVFKLYDLIPKDKWPCPEFQSIIYALNYNPWFNSLDCSGCALGNDSVMMVAEMMRNNTTITSLCLADAGASRAIITLIDAFNSNPKLALKCLNLSGNLIDAGCVATCLSGSLCKLSDLDISNAKITKMGLILESLCAQTFTTGLTKLNISLNRLNNQSSRMLGTLLSVTRSLEHLNISGTSPSWSSIVEGMIDMSGVAQNKTVTYLDISHNSTRKFQTELLHFLFNMPSVLHLNASDTLINPETLVRLLEANKSITSLDISENDISDDGIVFFMKELASVESRTNIKKLYMNRMFTKRTKKRSSAMKSIAKALNMVDIRELYISSCKLKEDILDFLFGLLNNKSLEVLDISGNQSGDPLAVAMAKIFQHNTTLHTVFWDGNEVTIAGLKSILLGLHRNNSILHMPLPLLDLATILKKENADSDLVDRLTKDIQRLVHEKALHFKKSTSSPELEPLPDVLPTARNLLSTVSSSASVLLNRAGIESEVSETPSFTAKPSTFLAVAPKTPLAGRRSQRQPSTGANTKKKHRPLQSVDVSRAAQLWGSTTEDTTSEVSSESAQELSQDVSCENLPTLNTDDPEDLEEAGIEKEGEKDGGKNRGTVKANDEDSDADKDHLDKSDPPKPVPEKTKRVGSAQSRHISKRKKKTQRGRPTMTSTGTTSIGLQRQYSKDTVKIQTVTPVSSVSPAPTPHGTERRESPQTTDIIGESLPVVDQGSERAVEGEGNSEGGGVEIGEGGEKLEEHTVEGETREESKKKQD